MPYTYVTLRTLNTRKCIHLQMNWEIIQQLEQRPYTVIQSPLCAAQGN